jgi:hypothetical protein
MDDPVTKLDTRFSDPEAVAIGWEQTRDALEAAELFWITTVRRDGRPHVTPLVAVWLDEQIYCTGPTEQKAINLLQNARVILTTGCNDWDRGTDIVLEGEAARVTDDAQLARLADAWVGKWDGRWQFTVDDGAFHHPDGGEALVFSVSPRKALVFGKNPFNQTSHRFSEEGD